MGQWCAPRVAHTTRPYWSFKHAQWLVNGPEFHWGSWCVLCFWARTVFSTTSPSNWRPDRREKDPSLTVPPEETWQAFSGLWKFMIWVCETFVLPQNGHFKTNLRITKASKNVQNKMHFINPNLKDKLVPHWRPGTLGSILIRCHLNQVNRAFLSTTNYVHVTFKMACCTRHHNQFGLHDLCQFNPFVGSMPT